MFQITLGLITKIASRVIDNMTTYNEEDEFEKWSDEHDFMIMWICESCNTTYYDYPGVNEGLPCNVCGKKTTEAGCKYKA